MQQCIKRSNKKLKTREERKGEQNKDHNRTWHTFRVLKNNNIHTHSHNIFISYIYIYAYKTPKNRGCSSLPGFPVAEADSEQCFLLQADSRLCWLRTQGHHSRATFTSCRPTAQGRDASEPMGAGSVMIPH